MADIQEYLNAISQAIYGEEVRGSIRDAIDLINKVGERTLNLGTAISSETDPVTGFYEDSLYLNTYTWDFWKCNGTGWVLQGNMRGSGIDRIYKKYNTGHVDTYEILLTGNIPGGMFDVTNATRFTVGTAVTAENTTIIIDGITYYANDLYLNSSTWILWQCDGTGWVNVGVIKGRDGIDGIDGIDGVDGISPTVTITKSGTITTITIVDKDGTHVANIKDGESGDGSGDMLKSVYDYNDDGVIDLNALPVASDSDIRAIINAR